MLYICTGDGHFDTGAVRLVILSPCALVYAAVCGEAQRAQAPRAHRAICILHWVHATKARVMYVTTRLAWARATSACTVRAATDLHHCGACGCDVCGVSAGCHTHCI